MTLLTFDTAHICVMAKIKGGDRMKMVDLNSYPKSSKMMEKMYFLKDY